MTRLIAVSGSSPGIGKSTECERLRHDFVAEGLRVDHFAEQEIATRPQFTAVWSEFETTGRVEPATLLTCTQSYVSWLLDSGYDVAITDALIPYTPSLFGFGLSEAAVAAFLVSLRTVLAPVEVEIHYLDGDPAVALQRAATREGDGWLRWFVDKVAGYPAQPAQPSLPEVHDLASAAAYLRNERDVTLRLLRNAGLPVRVLC